LEHQRALEKQAQEDKERIRLEKEKEKQEELVREAKFEEQRSSHPALSRPSFIHVLK